MNYFINQDNKETLDAKEMNPGLTGRVNVCIPEFGKQGYYEVTILNEELLAKLDKYGAVHAELDEVTLTGRRLNEWGYAE